jgi:hypothetical protein
MTNSGFGLRIHYTEADKALMWDRWQLWPSSKATAVTWAEWVAWAA